MEGIIKILRKIRRLFLYGNKCDSKRYLNHLRKLGMSIGDGVVIYNPPGVVIDETRPWLISIGNNVQITNGVTILTHGYDWSVLKKVYGEVLGSSGGGDNWR